MMLLETICKNTNEYILSKPKNIRKEIGQFFTSQDIAKFMASQINVDEKLSSISVLDPGTGSGILMAAAIEYIANNFNFIENISITLFENDSSVVELLLRNIKIAEEFCNNRNINLDINLFKENFILYNKENWINSVEQYDIVISNPPYKKIKKLSDESLVMEKIVFGQPNLYALFMALSASLLKKNGDFIFIVPRSWTSGKYFEKFREYLFKKINIQKIHLFKKRTDLFKEDSVLQETIIIVANKEPNDINNDIIISSSRSLFDIYDSSELVIKNHSCIQNFNGRYMFLPVNRKEIELLDKLNQYENTLLSLGYKLKTGVVVEFRQKDELFYKNVKNSFPVIQPCHLKNGKVVFPCKEKTLQYIRTKKDTVFLETKPSLFLKRFTNKEEKRRLQPSLFIPDDSFKFSFFSTENHITFLTKSTGDFSLSELYGFYALFNSTMWDNYYRILNGSTQVNSYEINAMPIPPLEIIKKMGRKLELLDKLDTETCDKVILEIIK